jgi:hypothetical protein
MVYSEFESMGSDETPEISTQCKEASTEQREGSLEGQLREASTEAASPLGAESDPESQSGNSGDNETASDNSGHVKVATMAALVGISYDFGQSNIMKTRIGLMESYTRYFSKGYGQPPGVESIPVPRVNEVVIVGVIYPGYRRPPIMTQNSGYNRFPPTANSWGTIHPVPENGPTTRG